MFSPLRGTPTAAWLVGPLCASLLPWAAACNPHPSLTSPTRVCVRQMTVEPCRKPQEIELLMGRGKLEILHSEDVPTGKQGAKILTLIAREPRKNTVFRVKWRALSTMHGLNDPRKEIAAYAFQKLFLDPLDYVVPPTVGRCFELADYRKRVNAGERASFAKTTCVFGVLSYWLEDAKDLDGAEHADWLEDDELLNGEQFDRDAVYRRTVADTNLLSHVIGNGDTHRSQFVLTEHAGHPRVYCVDYTIAFSPYRNPTLSAEDDWSNIVVPALSRESIGRLERVTRADLERLAVIEQYENRSGRLVPTQKSIWTVQRTAGIRWVGDQLQVGLTEKEIDYVYTRMRRLVDRASRGEIALF